jgi:hypothetical protein
MSSVGGHTLCVLGAPAQVEAAAATDFESLGLLDAKPERVDGRMEVSGYMERNAAADGVAEAMLVRAPGISVLVTSWYESSGPEEPEAGFLGPDGTWRRCKYEFQCSGPAGAFLFRPTPEAVAFDDLLAEEGFPPDARIALAGPGDPDEAPVAEDEDGDGGDEPDCPQAP